MKKLFLFIFLGFMWSNVGFTNDISKIENVEINGISIGDNLLDHFSKKELIQNKKLLDAKVKDLETKLYYTSLIAQEMFYYESNERFGMTEKPIYRIIGMSVAQSCDARSWKDEFSEDESIRLLTECIKTSFQKKLIKFDNIFLNLLDLYVEEKYDPEIQVMENGSLRYVKSTKLGTGCYSDQVSVKYYSMIIKDFNNKDFSNKDFIKNFIKKKKGEKIINENNKNMYYGPSMNIFLMSKELDEILHSSNKYC